MGREGNMGMGERNMGKGNMMVGKGNIGMETCGWKRNMGIISKTWDTLQVLWTTTDHYRPLWTTILSMEWPRVC